MEWFLNIKKSIHLNVKIYNLFLLTQLLSLKIDILVKNKILFDLRYSSHITKKTRNLLSKLKKKESVPMKRDKVS